MNISHDVVNLANQMLNNIGNDDYEYPQINIDDLPFLNIQDDIDNIEIKLEEPLINENLFEAPEELIDKIMNKKQKNKQV